MYERHYPHPPPPHVLLPAPHLVISMDFQNDYFCLPFHSPDVDFFQDASELRDLIYSGPEVEFRDWTAYPLLAPDQQAVSLLGFQG